ncbi:MAG: hypothetical protein HC780_02420 [Leptolyngbyaceae cyanobacterium CSU_1_3]|nr:hypothetical protein [Leptolyngbyaceae cyanobacterium CSU_1_3]
MSRLAIRSDRDSNAMSYLPSAESPLYRLNRSVPLLKAIVHSSILNFRPVIVLVS